MRNKTNNILMILIIVLFFTSTVTAKSLTLAVPTGVIIISSPPCCTSLPPLPELSPSYISTLRPYLINKNDEIWRADNPSSYITPDTPLVQYYALTGKTPQIFYRSDKELYPQNKDEDYWQNADYTLYTGSGDCEDLSIAMVSIYIAKGYKAVVVAGYLEDNSGNKIRDFWYEIINPNTNKKTVRLTSGSALYQNFKLIPKYMFNNKIIWRQYDENWNNN